MKHRWVTGITITVIIAISIATGPVFNTLNLVQEADNPVLSCNDGSGSITVNKPPAKSGELKQINSREEHVFISSAGQLHIDSVSECIEIRAKIKIKELGFVSQTIISVREKHENQTVSIEGFRKEFSAEKITKQEYNATIIVSVHGTDERQVYEQVITIPVR